MPMRADPLPGRYIIFAAMAILSGRVLVTLLTAMDSGLFPEEEMGRRKTAPGAPILKRV
jgi:hypothetical protein